jgi:hypothetical protein
MKGICGVRDADISNRERPLMAHLRRSANVSNERKPDSQRSRVELQSLFQLQTFVNQRH